MTALALAAMRGHADAARVLVAHGASPHAEDEDGKTPLSESQGEAEEITAPAPPLRWHRSDTRSDGRGEPAEPAFRGRAAEGPRRPERKTFQAGLIRRRTAAGLGAPVMIATLGCAPNR